MCVCVHNYPTADTTGQIMTEPDVTMVSDLGMVLNILAKSRVRRGWLLVGTVLTSITATMNKHWIKKN